MIDNKALVIFKPLNEFLNRLDDIFAIVVDARLAYSYFYKASVPGLDQLKENNTVSFGDGDPNNPNTIVRLTIPAIQFKERVKPDGKDTQIITQLCLVSIFQLWEEEYRKEISTSLGEVSLVLSDIFGDIRILRNSIIHNNSKKNSEFSKIKILKYMQDRDYVTINYLEFCEIIEHVHRDLSMRYLEKYPTYAKQFAENGKSRTVVSVDKTKKGGI